MSFLQWQRLAWQADLLLANFYLDKGFPQNSFIFQLTVLRIFSVKFLIAVGSDFELEWLGTS